MPTAEWGRSETNRKAKFYELTPAARRWLEAESTSFEALARIVPAPFVDAPVCAQNREVHMVRNLRTEMRLHLFLFHD